MTERKRGAQPSNTNTVKHGATGYELSGRLPAEMQGFDLALADELLDLVGGDTAYRIAAMSAARRATCLELAYSWLARDDIPVLWVEEVNGHKVVKWQPILNRLGSWHEGLRRDLDALGLTPMARAKLGVPAGGALDYEQILAAQRAHQADTSQSGAENGAESAGGDGDE